MTEHAGDCDGTWCSYCGCCEHGPAQDAHGCRASDASDGMRCPGDGCGCEGVMGYIAPTPPPTPELELESAPAQLHQETALFDTEPLISETGDDRG